MPENTQRKEYGEDDTDDVQKTLDDTQKAVWWGAFWMFVIGLALAYPLGRLSSPDTPLGFQLAWGTILGSGFGFVIVGFVDQFLRDRRWRREERRQRMR